MSVTKKYMRPGFFLSKIINPLLMKSGLITFLVVKGRKSGKWLSNPITPFYYKEQIYLVSPRGETHWVKNLRLAKEGKLIKMGKTQCFTGIELKEELRDSVVAAYRKQMKVTESQFRLLPELSDHPAFKIEFKS
jgi:hypothetical protein